jgi:hypothetical protein
MEGYEEKTSSVTVPKNTGVEGFMRTLRGILELRNVQSIAIDARGTVSYTRYVRQGETPVQLAVDYTSVEPWAIIRNGELEEVDTRGLPAASVVALLFNRVASEGLVPIAFASGAGTFFWSWHEETSGIRLSRRGQVYGLPLYIDRQMPDHSLVLCAAHVRGSLVDCHRFLTVTMALPLSVQAIPPPTEVQIL